MKEMIWFDSNSPKELLMEFCKHAENDPLPGASNMVLDNWENNPASFMYKLYIEKIYDKENGGRYFTQVEDGKVTMGMGVNMWDKDNNIALFATRLYRIPEMRGVGEKFITQFGHIVVQMHDFAIECGYKAAMVTNNHYNLKMKENYKRDQHKIDESIGRIYIHYDQPITVNYTKQWPAYVLYDDSYEDLLLEKFKETRWR